MENRYNRGRRRDFLADRAKRTKNLLGLKPPPRTELSDRPFTRARGYASHSELISKCLGEIVQNIARTDYSTSTLKKGAI